MPKANRSKIQEYFLYGLPILKKYWDKLDVPSIYAKSSSPYKFAALLAMKISEQDDLKHSQISTGELFIFSTLNRAYRYLISDYTSNKLPTVIEEILQGNKISLSNSEIRRIFSYFVKLYPGKPFIDRNITSDNYIKNILSNKDNSTLMIKEMLLLYISEINPGTDKLKTLYNTQLLDKKTKYKEVFQLILEGFKTKPILTELKGTLTDILLLPIKTHPHSLYEQLLFIIEKYGHILPPDLFAEALTAIDTYKEEIAKRGVGHGEIKVLDFKNQTDIDYLHEPEQFTPDRDWMTNVVLIAKMVYVWLHQLSKKYDREISRLDQIPDEELEQLASWGVNAIWLIGVWKRSPASQKIKHLMGNTDAIASAYSLYNYEIAEDLGGTESLLNLKERAGKRGIRLASDMVPNHTGIYSEWILQHPDWFIQTDEPPYPNYRFTGENLSPTKEISLYIEDGYWTKSDAAVTFKYIDNNTGKVRYIYHGNDGTSTPWNDTAQLNYLLPEVREAVIKTILKVAKLFPIIRFDAAMTLAKRHFQRLWFPLPGTGGAIPSRAQFSMTKAEFDRHMPKEFWREVVDRVSLEAPDTLLLAEAFWLMEGYFVRTLGMHRVYNSAFMNMLKLEENSKYRKTIKNVIEFDPEILKRFVNFMNNPDEKTAIEQFGKEKKYFGAAVMLATMPGLPMLGHGQIEGFQEKYGMEYKRCYWDEKVDIELVKEHEKRIFPLLRRRYLFSGSDNFVFYDFYSGDNIDENVFAYSNKFGEERAVVIYHNKFASTRGWFKNSTPFLKKEKGTTYFIKKTLGEALSLKDDANIFYIFKDYSDSLYYIRNGKELNEKGLYAELDAYDYHVFMDFSEVIDDSEGLWKHVCDYLNGRGDENIYELYKIIKNNAFLTTFKMLFQSINNQIKQVFQKKEEALDKFFKGLLNIAENRNISINISELKKLKDIFDFFYQYQKLLSQFFISSDVSSILSFSITSQLLNISPLNILKDDTLGIIPYIKRESLIKKDVSELKELLDLLLWKNIFNIQSNKEFKKESFNFFQDESVKKIIDVHTYSNIVWFNKEKFEELIFLLLVEALKERIKNPTNTLTASKSVMVSRFRRLIAASAKANYQFYKTLSTLFGN